jgi:amidase
MQILEASLQELSAALAAGQVTSVGLVLACLERIAAFDRAGPRLNAVPVLNPDCLTEAAASDLRRAKGQAFGPFDGIPYTAKESYKARGLPVAAGSPAFADLIADEDCFVIAELRRAGAILIGLTTMPPMANGGMQRGLRGRAESPYNGDFLAAAFASGSSNGSGTATAASFAAFGLAEETWSSGRAPAANSALCAYTPSRGLISIRGNWPLVPTMDVVVPHCRSMEDLLALLPLLYARDPETRGDFWRAQRLISLPPPQALPQSPLPLAGLRLALPKLYMNLSQAEAPGIGGPTGKSIATRPSLIALMEALIDRLERAGVEVILSDFPVIENYEGHSGQVIWDRLPESYKTREIRDLSAWAMDVFLRATGHPGLAHVDGAQIFPAPPGALPDRYDGFGDALEAYPQIAADLAMSDTDPLESPTIAEGLIVLEAIRKSDLEDWMDAHGFDAVIFPALADVARADSDTNPDSADHAWRNGVWVANGNLAIRHLGIPTVTLPLGLLPDIGMPAGLTIAGRAYDDSRLLALAWALEIPRPLPPRTPALPPPPVIPPNDAPERLLRVTHAGREVPQDLAASEGTLVTRLYSSGRGEFFIA